MKGSIDLQLTINQKYSLQTWVGNILYATQHSGGMVEHHLVGAGLIRRFKGLTIPNYPAHAGDQQTERVVEIYNKRLAEVETDLSLQIEVH